MIDASAFTAGRASRNATLDHAHQIVADLTAQGISMNPRIYADKMGFPSYMIPETATQDNSDAATWATENWDGSTLESLGLPNDQPVYLAILVVEGRGGGDNFCYVADIDAVMANQGLTLKQAVNVS